MRQSTSIAAVFGLVAVLIGPLAAVPARAETRALLIGVSDYEIETAGLIDLKGPANDVRLLRDVLAGRGVTDIRILADGVEGGQRPSRAAILAAFDALARDAEPGDLAFIHFSGHGTRQFDREGDETDGLDEVVMAIDAGRAAPGSGTIPNVIIDDEIGAAVAALRAKGADVWVVLDSCYSGSGLRAAPAPGVATRFVDPAALGLGVRATGAAPASPLDTGPEDLPGGYLAFYSARSSEVAREVDLAGPGGEAAWYGLFTAKLAARLQTGAGLSYRQLFQAVLSDLNDTAVPGAARLQTPSWEGDLIDAAVLGGRATEGVRRFAVDGDEIQAGLVHGLEDGTLVGLVADAAAPADAVTGHAQLEDVSATRGFLRPVAADCVPRAGRPCATAGRLPEDAGFAQVVARPLDRTVALAPPVDASGAPLPADAMPVLALTAALEAARAEGHRLRLDPADFDVQTLWEDGQLWFGPRAAVGASPAGLAWAPEGGMPLPALLGRIARAEDIARLLSAAGGAPSLLDPNPVAVAAELVPVDPARLAPPGAEVSPVRECRRALGAAGAAEPLPAGAELKQCDTLRFAAQGATPGARDVNRVYIDSQYCVRVDHELVEDSRAARRLGPDLTLCSDCPGGYAAGHERLFVVVTEVRENAEPLNLEGLLDTCTAAGGTRGAAADAALSMLAKAARRPGTRGSLGGFGGARIWVERYAWTVLPKSEVFLRAGLASHD